MEQIRSLIKDVPLPRVLRIRQKFDSQSIDDVEEKIRREMGKEEIQRRLKPGMTVALGVGSRGIAELPAIVRTVVAELLKAETIPFIVPAMGSHGGATAEGQREMLANLGITEESAGCPIRSSMEVVEIGRVTIPEIGVSVPVHMDRLAAAADGIAVINRVKPHTGFQGPWESGMAKMLTIGLGKQKGANTCHKYTYRYMGMLIEEMARMKIQKCGVLFALGIVENAYDRPAEIEAVPAELILQRDRELLVLAKEHMARFMFSQMDVLVVQRMGKNISGDGMDPNITGRWLTDYASGGPQIGKLAVLDLTEETHGNAVGIGAADLISQRLYQKLDLTSSYANALTTTGCNLVKVPMTLPDDRAVLQAAVYASNALEMEQVRMSVILDTLHMEDFYISESMEAEAMNLPEVEILTEPQEIRFDEEGNLLLDF